jgi:hypothetical protein
MTLELFRLTTGVNVVGQVLRSQVPGARHFRDLHAAARAAPATIAIILLTKLIICASTNAKVPN